MIALTQRIDLLAKLAAYLKENNSEWETVKMQALGQNGWFVEAFVNEAVTNIVEQFLNPEKLSIWAAQYELPEITINPKTVGIVMAGNIPLVGFHDFLCGFITGHDLRIKTSSKDSVLIQHLAMQLVKWQPELESSVRFEERLVGCNAYIATGSNNTGRYFEYYFRDKPAIIRKNRCAVAVLTGAETNAELQQFASDLLLYFGLGCRNVSKIYVPQNYNFEPLLAATAKYKWMEDHHKFKNNYDYNLSLHILNHQYYMTNGVLLLVEKNEIFSPISQVNYEYYDAETPPIFASEAFAETLQCVVGTKYMPFGLSQMPNLTDYADGVDTLRFFSEL